MQMPASGKPRGRRWSRLAGAVILVLAHVVWATSAAAPAQEHEQVGASAHGWRQFLGHSAETSSLNATIPWLAEYGSPRQGSSPNITRDEVIKRALEWVTKKIPYCQCPGDPPDCCGDCPYCGVGSPQFRCDCSGFVSWAWGLPGGLVTSTLPRVAREIEKHELKPGDVYLYDAVDGHVIIFNGWANSDKTEFHAIQEPGCNSGTLPPHACKNIQSVPVWGQPHLFKPYRYYHIVD